MRYLAKKLTAALGPTAMVHVARCNQARVPNFIVHPTHDGVDRGGERLAEEIRKVSDLGFRVWGLGAGGGGQKDE